MSLRNFRVYASSAVAIMLVVGLVAQTPKFEVASVKRHAGGPGQFPTVMWLPGGRMSATGLTLAELIRSAYIGDGIQQINQVLGGPDWIRNDRFDVIAKMPDETRSPSDDVGATQLLMLKALLTDQFALKLHMDQHDLPVFDLVVLPDSGKPRPQPKVSTCGVNGNRPCVRARMVAMNPTTGVTMAYEGMTMAEFAAAIAPTPEIGRPVRDRTGLTGKFDLQLTLAMPTPANSESGILTALPEQLGLKLEPRRAAAAVVVVDDAAQPHE